MQNILRRAGLASCIALFAATAVSAAPVQVMTFNVENLFDTADDPENPHDDTYLPLTVKQQRGPAHIGQCDDNGGSSFFRNQCKTLDWSAQVYATKLDRIAGVLKAMPALPDVLVLPETENQQVVDDLVAAVGAGSFATVVALDTSDKPDSRGIDVAIISKFQLVEPAKAHKIDFGNDSARCGATRDLVEAKFQLPDGGALTVLGAHFPSQGNDQVCRIKAFQQASSIRKSLGDQLVILAGDLNFDCQEMASPLYERLVQRGGWYLSPVVTAGCYAPGSSKFVDYQVDTWNTWSFLDQILVSASLSPSEPSTGNWFADLGSFQTVVVYHEQVAVDEDGKGYVEPRRFDPVAGKGVSDHWPVMMRLLNRR